MIREPAKVRFDAHRGELQLGALTVVAENAGSRGELRLGGKGGPVLRPARFADRTRAAVRAASSSAPRDAIARAILDCSTVEWGAGGELPRPALELAALWLAGAEGDLPDFAATALAVARGFGWDLSSLLDAEAAEIDRLAAALAAPSRATDGWNQLLIGGGAAAELDALRDQLADRLLARATANARDEAALVDDPGSWIHSVERSAGPAIQDALAAAGPSSPVATARPIVASRAATGREGQAPVARPADPQRRATIHAFDAASEPALSFSPRPSASGALSRGSSGPRAHLAGLPDRVGGVPIPGLPVPAGARAVAAATPLPAVAPRSGPAALALAPPALLDALPDPRLVASAGGLERDEAPDGADTADAIAALLDEESNLRGLL